MLITEQNIVCMEDDQYSVSSADTNALMHVIQAQCSRPNVDYWLPVCLPSIAADGYLNMYYRNIKGVMGVVLLSSVADNIADAVLMCQKIEISLKDEKVTEMIKKYSKLLPLEPSRLVSSRGVWLYKHRAAGGVQSQQAADTLVGHSCIRKADQTRATVVYTYEIPEQSCGDIRPVFEVRWKEIHVCRES